MILSGILAEKAEMVLEAARRRFDLVGRKDEGDWVALVVREGAD
ncbi:MAG: 50S ribosomal protein L11 methyltransferase [Caldilineaceae bacterium]